MPKQYKLLTSTESAKLNTRHSILGAEIASLGMVLGRDAIPIAKGYRDAVKTLTGTSFLMGTFSEKKIKEYADKMTEVASEIAVHTDKMTEVASEIAVHTHKASVIKEVKKLRDDCVKHFEQKKILVEAKKPMVSNLVSLALYGDVRTRIIDGEEWVKLSDLKAAFHLTQETTNEEATT